MNYDTHDHDERIHDAAPEQKAGISRGNDAHDELMRSFEEFKSTNDERLAAIGHRADVLLDEKVDRINGATTS